MTRAPLATTGAFKDRSRSIFTALTSDHFVRMNKALENSLRSFTLSLSSILVNFLIDAEQSRTGGSCPKSPNKITDLPPNVASAVHRLCRDSTSNCLDQKLHRRNNRNLLLAPSLQETSNQVIQVYQSDLGDEHEEEFLRGRILPTEDLHPKEREIFKFDSGIQIADLNDREGDREEYGRFLGQRYPVLQHCSVAAFEPVQRSVYA
ncbi:hypothetical protein RCL_jg13331.t2 [Rhizophagus clarus]|uniref:Uncharacterized protein n=1 Tax=Rhizophagus clarus TaxID=94130 RepID=A0A8H3LQA3_9GLOM|nr:hypothetical protein RCL_jg13331.t2 [Rhizophagus clarus]